MFYSVKFEDYYLQGMELNSGYIAESHDNISVSVANCSVKSA